MKLREISKSKIEAGTTRKLRQTFEELKTKHDKLVQEKKMREGTEEKFLMRMKNMFCSLAWILGR